MNFFANAFWDNFLFLLSFWDKLLFTWDKLLFILGQAIVYLGTSYCLFWDKALFYLGQHELGHDTWL